MIALAPRVLGLGAYEESWQHASAPLHHHGLRLAGLAMSMAVGGYADELRVCIHYQQCMQIGQFLSMYDVKKSTK